MVFAICRYADAARRAWYYAYYATISRHHAPYMHAMIPAANRTRRDARMRARCMMRDKICRIYARVMLAACRAARRAAIRYFRAATRRGCCV